MSAWHVGIEGNKMAGSLAGFALDQLPGAEASEDGKFKDFFTGLLKREDTW